MVDDAVLSRWMSLEMGNLARSLVLQPRLLEDPLAEREPSARTKEGEVHRFDVAALRRLSVALTPLARLELRLPMRVHFDHQASGDCYVDDPAAARALAELGVVKTSVAAGRSWFSAPLGWKLAHDWPTLVQFVFH